MTNERRESKENVKNSKSMLTYFSVIFSYAEMAIITMEARKKKKTTELTEKLKMTAAINNNGHG